MQNIFNATIEIVNVCIIGTVDNGWILVHVRTAKSARKIIDEEEERFGNNAKPGVII